MLWQLKTIDSKGKERIKFISAPSSRKIGLLMKKLGIKVLKTGTLHSYELTWLHN